MLSRVGPGNHVLDGGSHRLSWRIPLNRPCAAMRPCVKLFWPLVTFSSVWRRCVSFSPKRTRIISSLIRSTYADWILFRSQPFWSHYVKAIRVAYANNAVRTVNCFTHLLSQNGTSHWQYNPHDLFTKACHGRTASRSPRGSVKITTGAVVDRNSNFYNDIVRIYCVPKKRPTFTTCYNFYMHSSIATIFGTNVAKKVDNQNILYFPTSPNRNPGNCVFSLKWCMLIHHKNTKHS